MSKWRLIFKALPFVLIIIILKLSLVMFLDFNGYVDLVEVRILLTAGVFLLGFMLAGTLADYKESEKIPGEIAIALESIEELSQNLAIKTGLDVHQIRLEMLALSMAVHDWFYKRISPDDLYTALTNFNTTIQRIDKAGGAPPILGRLIIQMHDLRKLATRTYVISRTGFLATGYALLELLLVIVSILLLVAKFDNIITEVVRIVVVGLIYIYMYMLIKDIDDPFEYKEGVETGLAEVSLFPIEDYIDRLEKRIENKVVSSTSIKDPV